MKFPSEPSYLSNPPSVHNTMKSSYMFRDQVRVVTDWYKGWNACEKTVVVYSLLRKIPAPQAKFLLQVLSNSLLAETNDLLQSEAQANDPGIFPFLLPYYIPIMYAISLMYRLIFDLHVIFGLDYVGSRYGIH